MSSKHSSLVRQESCLMAQVTSGLKEKWELNLNFYHSEDVIMSAPSPFSIGLRGQCPGIALESCVFFRDGFSPSFLLLNDTLHF